MIVPISAHALFARPVVVGPDSQLAVEVVPRTQGSGVVWCDGRRAVDLPPGARIQVHRSPDPVRLARFAASSFADRLVAEDVLSKEDVERFDHDAIEVVDDAVKFADESPFPDLDSLYDDVYVYDSDVPAWWTIDERTPEVHRGEREREAGDMPHQLAEQGAAYAGVERRARPRDEGRGEPGEEAD